MCYHIDNIIFISIAYDSDGAFLFLNECAVQFRITSRYENFSIRLECPRNQLPGLIISLCRNTAGIDDADFGVDCRVHRLVAGGIQYLFNTGAFSLIRATSERKESYSHAF
jgi:hypothetical protein